jgi:hypothetical protein
MDRRKTSRKTAKPAKAAMNKSDFVRSMGSRPAKEVVALAAKRGMKLSERYVYVIRSADKAKARRRGQVRVGGGSADASLREAIAEVGLVRARQILGEVEAAFGGHVRPPRHTAIAAPRARRTITARNGRPTKASFILGLPRDMPAKEVVAAGAAKGVRFSDHYVHRIRSASN